MKKLTLLFLAIAASFTIAAAQTKTIIGKWKPVKLEMKDMFITDIKTGKFELDKRFDTDEELKGSKKIMEAAFKVLVDEMKVVVEQYTKEGKHIEINTKTGEKTISKFIYDAKNQTVKVVGKDKKADHTMKITFTDKGFIGTATMDGFDDKKQVEMTVTYEKVSK